MGQVQKHGSFGTPQIKGTMYLWGAVFSHYFSEVRPKYFLLLIFGWVNTQTCIILDRWRRAQREKAWMQHSFPLLWWWLSQWTLWGVLEGGGLCKKKVGVVGSMLTPMPRTTLGVSAHDVVGWQSTSTLRGIWLKAPGCQSGKPRSSSAMFLPQSEHFLQILKLCEKEK